LFTPSKTTLKSVKIRLKTLNNLLNVKIPLLKFTSLCYIDLEKRYTTTNQQKKARIMI